MNIALTGASGFIGSAIARHAHKNGHKVTALVRESSKRKHIEPYVTSFIVAEQGDPSVFPEFLDGADVVIHNSYDWSVMRNKGLMAHLNSNLLGSISLLEASEQRHFIFLSSIAVHHHMHANWNGTIDESHPTRPGSFYGAYKASVEAHMWAANASRGQQVTSLRPTAVYGIDPVLKRTIGYPIVQTIREGKPITKLGGGKFVNVEDVAAVAIACIDNPKASPCVYNLANCYARWSDWATIAAELLHANVEIDMSSPPAPKNTFDTADVTKDLGIELNRGIDDIRKAIEELILAT